MIPNPMEIAKVVAELILSYSYRADGGETKVHDVLLFGSTFQGEAHDVDMLLIHNLPRLYEFGIVTRYDASTGSVFPDLDAKREDQHGNPQQILNALGSPELQDPIDKIMCLMEDFYTCYETRRVSGYEILPRSETVRFDVIGDVYVDIEDQDGSEAKVNAAIEEKIKQRQAITKIAYALQQRSLPIEDTLDLHVMHRSLLSPGREEDRGLVIRQCRDPTFWYSVLTSGVLYNTATGKFDTSVNQRYPHAYHLFRP